MVAIERAIKQTIIPKPEDSDRVPFKNKYDSIVLIIIQILDKPVATLAFLLCGIFAYDIYKNTFPKSIKIEDTIIKKMSVDNIIPISFCTLEDSPEITI